MTARLPPLASLDAGAGRVTLRDGLWSETFPLERLPAKLAFYQQMARKYPRGNYAATAAALEAVAAEAAALPGAEACE